MPRFLRLVIAAAAGLALALTAVTTASASPSHVHLRAAAGSQLAEPGRPIMIHTAADTSGIIGYAICLYHKNNHCVSDTAGRAKGSVIFEILNTVGDGITVWTVIKAAHKSYKWVKKYLYQGKHVYKVRGDGLCMADFGYNRKATLSNCADHHGIYWQDNKGRLWDTYAKGDLIASSLTAGTRLFVHSREDWATWTLRPVCANTC